MKRQVEGIKKIIVKVGSTNLCDTNGVINKQKILNIVEQLAYLRDKGYEVVLVSSGAVAAGMGAMNLKSKPSTIPQKQALAAIGQAKLMEIYEELFDIFGIKCSQILLNLDDFDDRKRLLNLFHTMNALVDYGVIPIINENDALAVDEIKVGDNDTLAALLVPVVEAQLLILVSDIDGLYTDDPRVDPDAQFLSFVEKVDHKVMSYAGDTGSNIGTGGMGTKLNAAKIVNAYGSHMCIVNGNKPNSIINALKDEGTWFNGDQDRKLKARTHWIAYRSRTRGKVVVDDGCKKALLERHTSLLPKGIIGVLGDFRRGQVVAIVDKDEHLLGRGVVNYSSEEIRLIKGKKTSEIMDILHHKDYDEVIHANNIVIYPE